MRRAVGQQSFWQERTTPTGQKYWIDTRDPEKGYLRDPSKNPGEIWYPIEYINWMSRGGPPAASEVRTAATGQKAREVSGAALNGKIGLLYGERTTGASIFFGPRVLNPLSVVIGYGLGHGPSESLISIDWGLIPVFNPGSLFQTQFYPGDLAPASADSFFAGTAGVAIGSMERYPGLTHVRAVATWNTAGWAKISGIPMPRFKWRGRKVRNYLTGLDAWTDNPAYCLADYIVSSQYGRGARVNVQSVIDAAAECDVLVMNTATGLNMKRHTLNLFIMRDASHKAVMDMIRAHCRITVIERGGEFVFLYDKDRATAMTFDKTEAVPVSIARLGGSGIPNSVTVKFPDPTKGDEIIPEVARTAEVQAGTAFVKNADYELEGCTTNFHAASEAYYTLNTKLNNLLVVLRAVHPKARKLEPDDVIAYTTDAFGMTAFKLRVLRVTKAGDGTSYMVECAGHDPAIYTFQMRAIEAYPVPVLPDPFTTPPGDVYSVNAAQREARVYVSWSAVPDQDVSKYELRRGPVGVTWADSVYVADVVGTEYLDEPPIGAWTYLVKAIGRLSQLYSVNAARADLSVFFFGVDGSVAETSLAYALTGSTYGDTRLTGGQQNVVEGVTVHGQMTIMLARGSSSVPGFDVGQNPTLADAEIVANGYATIQAWEDGLDAPRRQGQGIWAPLIMNVTGQITGAAYTGRFFIGDGLGWRNFDLKMRVANVQRIGRDTPGIIAKLEPIWQDSNVALGANVLSPSPARVGQRGSDTATFVIFFSTNDPLSQAIARPLYSQVVFYQKQQFYPRVMAPTDYVSDGGGLVTFTYPIPMLATFPAGTPVDQVPHIDVEIISNVSAAFAVTALTRTGATVKIFNPATGAVLSGVSVRISADDRGGGGSLLTI